jgi:hypothetical protein
MKTNIRFWSYLSYFFLEWEMFYIKLVQKIKTRILCSITSFFLNRTDDEIMWKNIVELGSPRVTIWHMRTACRITKASNSQSDYVILIAFPLQQRFHKSASTALYVHCLSCFLIVLVYFSPPRQILGQHFVSHHRFIKINYYCHFNIHITWCEEVK